MNSHTGINTNTYIYNHMYRYTYQSMYNVTPKIDDTFTGLWSFGKSHVTVFCLWKSTINAVLMDLFIYAHFLTVLAVFNDL